MRMRLSYEMEVFDYFWGTMVELELGFWLIAMFRFGSEGVLIECLQNIKILSLKCMRNPELNNLCLWLISRVELVKRMMLFVVSRISIRFHISQVEF